MPALGGILSTSTVLAGTLLLQDSTQVIVASSAAENTLVTHTIPANAIGDSDVLYARFQGGCKNNEGNARGFTVRLKADATPNIQQVFDLSDPTGLSDNVTARQWIFESWFTPNAANNSVDIMSHFRIAPPNAVGSGDFAAWDEEAWSMKALQGIAIQSSWLIRLTVEPEVSHANLTFTYRTSGIWVSTL